MVTMTVDGKDYVLKATTKKVLEMEDRLGFNPLNVIIRMRNEELPKLGEVLIILHCLLQSMNHGLSFADTIDLYTNYCQENENGMLSVLQLIIKAFEDSGLIKIDDEDPNL